MSSQRVMERPVRKGKFNPLRLVSDEEYGANLNAIIAYYQIAKGEAKKRLASSWRS